MADETRILVVEDDVAELTVLEMVLRDNHYNVSTVNSGHSCLDQVHNLLPESMLPDLVILDIQLPDISGYEVCEKIKNHSITSRIPVLMLTSNDLNTEFEAGFDAGADEYIVKPIDSARLISAIESIIALDNLS